MQPGETAAQAIDRVPFDFGEVMAGRLPPGFENARFEFGDGLAPSAARVD